MSSSPASAGCSRVYLDCKLFSAWQIWQRAAKISPTAIGIGPRGAAIECSPGLFAMRKTGTMAALAAAAAAVAEAPAWRPALAKHMFSTAEKCVPASGRAEESAQGKRLADAARKTPAGLAAARDRSAGPRISLASRRPRRPQRNKKERPRGRAGPTSRAPSWRVTCTRARGAPTATDHWPSGPLACSLSIIQVAPSDWRPAARRVRLTAWRAGRGIN